MPMMPRILVLVKYASIVLVFVAVHGFVWQGTWNKPGPAGKKKSWKPGKGFSLQDVGRMDDEQIKNLNPGLLFSGFNLGETGSYFIIILGAGLGFLAPRVLRALLKKQRKAALEAELPDALELVANSLRAGLSLVQALEVASQESPRPISEELEEIIRGCRLGLAPVEALEKFLKRWPNPDLELFVVAASVSLRTGGNLAEVAGRIIETIRERVRLKGRIEALTSQGKLSGWVVGLLPLALLAGLSFLDPELMAGFFRHPLGYVILSAGLVMELIGAFFIGKITAIDV